MKITRFGAAAVSTAALLALAACGDNTQTPATDAAPADDMAMAPATTDPMVGGAAMSPNDNIVANASKASNLTTLVSAVQAAGLVETLQGPGPFTVFAPDNGAFEKIPAATREGLMQPAQRDALRGILTYHVVPGAVKAADVVKLKEAKTAQGQSVKIKVQDGKVFIDGAQVVVTDIECSNGIIHVIDSVILPSDK